MKNLIASIILVLISLNVMAQKAALPVAPNDPKHPGSKIYSYASEEKKFDCNGREVQVFVPKSSNANEVFPAVIYGHGQALDVANYRGTMEHLAKKGIVAVFPTYDTGFFDQDWIRMGRDYVTVSQCAIAKAGVVVDKDQIVFSGHSKGAYVASVASGLAFKESLSLRPQAVVLFAPAGWNSNTLAYVDPQVSYTIAYSDQDTIVDFDISQNIYQNVKSTRKQLIKFKSYTETARTLKADHFWPLTKGSFAGGGSESAFHYYGSWRWLVAAALDLKEKTAFSNPHLYGDEAINKGVPGLTDSVQRSW
jgi:hypothetical protein